MMAAQQLSGINAVFLFSNLIFECAGFKDPDSQNFASVGVGGFNVLTFNVLTKDTIVKVAIIERMGRKKLIVYGFGFMVSYSLAYYSGIVAPSCQETIVYGCLVFELGMQLHYRKRNQLSSSDERYYRSVRVSTLYVRLHCDHNLSPNCSTWNQE